MVLESERGKERVRAGKERMGALEGEVKTEAVCDKARDPGEGSKVSLLASPSTQYFCSGVPIPSYSSLSLSAFIF